jgi:hypothetical protein
MRVRTASAWTIWVMLIGLLLGGAYAIVERANPGLRSGGATTPATFGH